ncbi:MAG TPA: hypothetical protein VIJ62_00390 [Rhizomicrobium sp.]
MFEITSDHIAQLNDEQLRTLIALLCEAELRTRGYSPAAVTWGGNQNAGDGGLDVRVALPNDKPIDGFIPRPSTGFQVKKQDMPPSAIGLEMRPSGAIRPVIQELADNGGAYAIVSSEGSTSDIALRRRRDAMAEATKDLANAKQLALDFYDRIRVASWVRNHAGLIIWVRNTIGRTIPGWEPYGAWANPNEGMDAEYLLDEGIRVRQRPAISDGDFATAAGLAKIREILARPRSVVRLVGLSGVGKTRFVQALFDSRIGENSLDPSLAIYTNMNNGPDPQPTILASDLIANTTRAILIIDNCASELHGRLSEVAKKPPSELSILTVEYDIRDDQPEGTSVFEVQVASTDLIEKLLRRRFPNLSQIDAHTAADFSGGNARIAIALTDTVAQSGTLDHLTDDQLFQRLFVQRQDQDKALLEVAQVCSLVYSFNGEDISEGDEGELTKLAKIIGKATDDVYRGVAELLRRDLAQRRGIWRAVLPHAVANRLAATALQNIPYARIEDSLVNGASERLAKSFAKRLSYLHANREAVDIVGGWLSQGGWISDVWNLNEFGKAIFQNVLSTNPDAALHAIEINVPAHDQGNPIVSGDYLSRAIRSLAYAAALFERCTNLLQTLVQFGSAEISKNASEIHTSLFHIFLSGTHASVEQRANVAKKLLLSANRAAQALGLSALNGMLQTRHFSSHYDFQFGAHSRNYGYMPKTYGEIAHWYRTAFALAEEIILSNHTVSGAAQAQLAAHFRGLWANANLRDELENLSLKIAARGFWAEGWQAVKQTRHYDEKDTKAENYVRLSKLEEKLRPVDLAQRVRGRVLTSKGGGYYDVDDVDVSSADSYRIAMEKKVIEAEVLGADVASDPRTFRELLPELFSASGNLWHFGMGLAKATKNKRDLWRTLTDEFSKLEKERRDFRLLSGILWQWNLSDPDFANELLDDALESPTFAPYFPMLQSAVTLDQRGMQRLLKSLQIGKVPTHIYNNLALGRATDKVPPGDLVAFILALTEASDGVGVAVHILSMQYFADNSDKNPHAPELVAVGRQLVTKVKFDRRDQQEDFELDNVVEGCLLGDEGYAPAVEMCASLKQAVASYKTNGFDHNQLLKALFRVQPAAALDAFFTGGAVEIALGSRILEEVSYLQPNPMDQIPQAGLIEWCQRDAVIRFPAIASSAAAFTLSADHNPSGWTPLASALVHNAPDTVAVMEALVERLRPRSWSGSRATILETNAKLLRSFDARGDVGLAAFIETAEADLLKEANAEREWENKRDRGRDERFEY